MPVLTSDRIGLTGPDRMNEGSEMRLSKADQDAVSMPKPDAVSKDFFNWDFD